MPWADKDSEDYLGSSWRQGSPLWGSEEYVDLFFPYCCRYKERGILACHEGKECDCSCHETKGMPK